MIPGLRGAVLVAFVAAGYAGKVVAQVDLAGAKQCVAERIAAAENPMGCIDAAHATCQATPADSPAVAILCFREAKAVWDGAITAEMADIRARAEDRIAAIAAVELKYDLIASLTQCDRLEELARVGSSQPAGVVQRQKAQCEASAAALAYLRTSLRAGSLK